MGHRIYAEVVPIAIKRENELFSVVGRQIVAVENMMVTISEFLEFQH